MNKFEMGQRVEIHSLPDFSADSVYNGTIATVVALPGYNTLSPLAYGLRFDDGPNVGKIEPGMPQFLRPFPPKLPSGRADIDKVSTWEDFDKATGLDSSKFRFNPTN